MHVRLRSLTQGPAVTPAAATGFGVLIDGFQPPEVGLNMSTALVMPPNEPSGGVSSPPME